MRLLEYKEAIFESFDIEKDGEYADEGHIDSLETFVGGYVTTYACPDCIRKYGLYEETDTTEESLNELDDDGYMCCVRGCSNRSSYDVTLSPSKCRLV